MWAKVVAAALSASLLVEPVMLFAQTSNDFESANVWQVRPIGKDRAEIVGPNAKYLFEATPAMIKIEAESHGRVVETDTLEHTGHVYNITSSVGNHRLRVDITTGEKQSSAHVELGSEKFRVEGSSCGEMGFKLVRELRKRDVVKPPLINELSVEMRDNPKLIGDLKKMTRVENLMREPDVVMAACVAICLACSATQWELCPWCAICFERF